MIQILLIKNDLSQPEIGYMEYKDVKETIIGCAYRVYNNVQLVNYLIATVKPVALILNFGERKVEIKRKMKDLR